MKDFKTAKKMDKNIFLKKAMSFIEHDVGIVYAENGKRVFLTDQWGLEYLVETVNLKEIKDGYIHNFIYHTKFDKNKYYCSLISYKGDYLFGIRYDFEKDQYLIKQPCNKNSYRRNFETKFSNEESFRTTYSRKERKLIEELFNEEYNKTEEKYLKNDKLKRALKPDHHPLKEINFIFKEKRKFSLKYPILKFIKNFQD